MLKKNNLVMTLLFSEFFLLAPTFKSDLAVNFIKNIIFNNDIEEKSTLKRIIESVKYFNLEQKDSVVKILNMTNNQSFNNVNDGLDIDDKTT